MFMRPAFLRQRKDVGKLTQEFQVAWNDLLFRDSVAHFFKPEVGDKLFGDKFKNPAEDFIGEILHTLAAEFYATMKKRADNAEWNSRRHERDLDDVKANLFKLQWEGCQPMKRYTLGTRRQ